MSKKDLLKEELKRHMQLLEYTFYMPEVETADEEKENLLFDTETLLEQDPVPGEETEEVEVGAEEEGDPFAGDDEVVDIGTDTIPPEAPEGEGEVDPFAGGEEGALGVEDEFADEEVGGEETVEVDVTDIVDKAEETRTEIAGITAKMDELMGNLSSLSDQVSGMDQVIGKIENLEKEIEKRNPTPVEKLEMRSMDSFPYSIKLTDYWQDKEGYDVNGEEEDFTLTQQEVDDYSETEIEDSFNYNENDQDY